MLVAPRPKGAQQGQQTRQHRNPKNADQTVIRAQNAASQPTQQSRKTVGNNGVKRLPTATQSASEMLRQQSDADSVVRGKRQRVQGLREQQ